MKWMVISNPKPTNLDAIEMLGGTDKSGGGFVGQFGTGMKYAVAAALRNKIDLRICTDGKLIQFGVKPVSLDRGDVFRITMKVDTAAPKDRDWTLDMGKYDWRDKPEEGLNVDWMIAREFICNAVDEGGATIGVETKIHPEKGVTKVYLRMTDRIQFIADNMDLFINRGLGKERQVVEKNKWGAVYPISSGTGRVYCKGIFVRTAPEQMLYDYDFNALALTESRTIDPYNMSYAMGKLLSEASTSFIANFLTQVSNTKCFENTISPSFFSFNKDKIKDAFVSAFGETAYMIPNDGLPMSTSDALKSCGGSGIALPSYLRQAIKAANHDIKDYIDIIGKDILDGFEYIPNTEVSLRVDPELNEMCCKAFQVCKDIFKPKATPTFQYFNWTGSPEAMALGKPTETGIAINAKINRDYILVLGTMMEEFAHFISGAPDFTRALTDCLVNNFARYVQDRS